MHTTLFLRQNYNQRTFFCLPRKKIGELCIIRHAKSDHNEKGCCAGFHNHSQPTQEGIKETRKGAKLLSANSIKFDTLYVSPLDRAFITAQTLLKELPVPKVIISEALIERNFGAFTGMSKAQIKEKLTPEQFKNYIEDKNFFPPDIGPAHKYFRSEELYGTWPNNHKSESYQCVMNRINSFLEKIKEELLNGQNILLVGHSHNLQILQMLLCKDTFEHGIEQYKINHVTPIHFKFSLNFDNKLIVKDRIKLEEKHVVNVVSSVPKTNGF